ncbi:MAG: DUF2203 domain-containing protein [Planctomycetes bacterium]|nr:DUF2203 domain-containing protein [Planctomycetota bacterium]
MKGKIFTVDEANRMLPLVARIADDIVRTYGEVNTALQAYEAAKAAAGGDDASEAELRRRDAEVGEVLDRFQALIQEIEALGGTVKDYERGFIDFYGDVAGEIVYLCWTRGETSIGHWHRLEEGYAKRRALPVLGAAA